MFCSTILYYVGHQNIVSFLIFGVQISLEFESTTLYCLMHIFCLAPHADCLLYCSSSSISLFIYLLRIRVRAYPRAKKWCEQLNDKIIFKHCNFLQKKNVSSTFFQYLEKLKEFDGVSRIQMTCSMRLMNHFIRDLSWRLKPMILILIDF